jgi:hypothetical protein
VVAFHTPNTSRRLAISFRTVRPSAKIRALVDYLAAALSSIESIHSATIAKQ